MFATCSEGAFGGFRLDDEGRIWASAGDGGHCLAPNGDLIGKVVVSEQVSNVAFGGAKGHGCSSRRRPRSTRCCSP